MTDYFNDIPVIRFEGTETDNELAYRYYDKDRVVLGKRMEDHLRFAACFWHTFCWPGSDVFGAGTFDRPWHRGANDGPASAAKRAAAFDFFTRLDIPYYCFHDVDVMADAHTVAEHRSHFAEAVDDLERLQASSGRKLLWGTANLFSHRRYAAGAATNPDPEVFAYAAAQVCKAMDATHRLGGANYVLWGGREGYDTLLNTDLRREAEQLGRFLAMVVEHKHRSGFTGTLLIEPKPHEPTKHQYDFDSATVYGFLLSAIGLENEVKVNIEANHATLAGHTLRARARVWRVRSVSSGQRSTPTAAITQNGWDTDQFPNSASRRLTLAMVEILRAGGFTTGGFNFDAKVRRQSHGRPSTCCYGHIGGIDTAGAGPAQCAAAADRGWPDRRDQGRTLCRMGRRIRPEAGRARSRRNRRPCGQQQP
jgi:xylose isomerase